MHLSLQSRYSWWAIRGFHHERCISYQPWGSVLYHCQTKLSFLYFVFYFPLSMNTTLCHHHPCPWLFLLFQIFNYFCHIFSDNPNSYALFSCNGTLPCRFFCYCYISDFLFFSSFSFQFSGHHLSPRLLPYLWHLQHNCLYCLLYTPMVFSFLGFSSFLFLIYFLPVIHFLWIKSVVRA